MANASKSPLILQCQSHLQGKWPSPPATLEDPLDLRWNPTVVPYPVRKTIIYCKWAPASFRFHVLKMLGVPTPARFFWYPGEVPVPFSTIICDKFLWWFNNILPKSLPPELQKLTDEFDPWTVRRAGSDRKNRLVDGWPTPIGIECGGMFNRMGEYNQASGMCEGSHPVSDSKVFLWDSTTAHGAAT